MSPTHMAIVLSRDPSATGYAHTRGEEDSRRTEMASFPVRYGVDAVETEEDPPYCPHGPTLIFERYYSDRDPRRFFACAVHRDRKGCRFFQWADEPISEEKRERWKSIFKDSQPVLDRKETSHRLEAVRSLAPEQRSFCRRCGRLLLEQEPESHRDEGHSVQEGLSITELAEPSKLLSPVDDRKAQAQFHFSRSVVQLLCSELQRLSCTKVLCVGTPRLQEALPSTTGIDSLLLDIDHRYAQFHLPGSYQRYSMFNAFFYESEGAELCRKFLRSAGTVAMVIDPPFGGLAEVLGRGIRKLWEMAGKELPTILVFPYFMESHVVSAMPSLVMSDYQVTYDNHRHFSSSAQGSKPSPVRLFSNLPAPGIPLPPDQGYRLCPVCRRYVSAENVHCQKCNICPSKDGRRYVHCDHCGRCVKPGRVHCPICSTCELPNHSCEPRPAVGCHICGSIEHKRRDCPEKKDERTLKRKQKAKKKWPKAKRKKVLQN